MQSDSDHMRSLMNQVQQSQHTPVMEALGQPLGLLKQLALSVASAFDPSKQWKLMTGIYANQLYALWKKSSPPGATGEDLISWFETNKHTGFGAGASDLSYKNLNYIVSKAVGGDLDKPLQDAQLQKIFWALADAVARQLRGFTQKLIQNATQEQQQQVLQLLPQLQKFVVAHKQNMSLNKIALWMLDHVPGVSQPPIIQAFRSWKQKLMPLGVAGAVLPTPFDAMNKQPLSSVELSAVLALLDELLLQVLLNMQQTDSDQTPVGAPKTTTPVTVTPATTATKPSATPMAATTLAASAAPDLQTGKQQLVSLVNQGFKGYESTGIAQQMIDQINQVTDLEDLEDTRKAITQFVDMWNRTKSSIPSRGNT